MEYGIDVAKECHQLGINAVAVTAGYMCREPRIEFYQYMDAANVDLKGFTERFYKKITGSSLAPVLDTLCYLKEETDVWFEITTLLIPDENDSSAEIEAESKWIMDNLGPEIPVHFTAFHPDWKMMDKEHTPPATLTRAREIAMKNGLYYVYTGNVHDSTGSSTYCPKCRKLLIERDWYVLGQYNITDDGHCQFCGCKINGVFQGPPGEWGAKRVPVRLSDFDDKVRAALNNSSTRRLPSS